MQTSLSFVISILSAILIFSSMQFCKQFLLSSQILTIFAGMLGSWLFIMLLTVRNINYDTTYCFYDFFQLQAISNMETIVLHKGFQARWFPEIIICLVISCFACSTIHRVAVSSCLLGSFVAIYFLNKISIKFHVASANNENSLYKKKFKKI